MCYSVYLFCFVFSLFLGFRYISYTRFIAEIDAINFVFLFSTFCPLLRVTFISNRINEGKMNILFIFHRNFFLLNLIDHQYDQYATKGSIQRSIIFLLTDIISRESSFSRESLFLRGLRFLGDCDCDCI